MPSSPLEWASLCTFQSFLRPRYAQPHGICKSVRSRASLPFTIVGADGDGGHAILSAILLLDKVEYCEVVSSRKFEPNATNWAVDAAVRPRFERCGAPIPI